MQLARFQPAVGVSPGCNVLAACVRHGPDIEKTPAAALKREARVAQLGDLRPGIRAQGHGQAVSFHASNAFVLCNETAYVIDLGNRFPREMDFLNEHDVSCVVSLLGIGGKGANAILVMTLKTERPQGTDEDALVVGGGVRGLLAEAFPDNDLLFFDLASLDVAVVGVAERLGLPPVVVYDRQKLIQAFVDDGMSEEEALEWVGYSIDGAYVGESTPLLLTTVAAAREA